MRPLADPLTRRQAVAAPGDDPGVARDDSCVIYRAQRTGSRRERLRTGQDPSAAAFRRIQRRREGPAFGRRRVFLPA